VAPKVSFCLSVGLRLVLNLHSEAKLPFMLALFKCRKLAQYATLRMLFRMHPAAAALSVNWPIYSG
jgi:hypothetical protein